MPSKRYPNKIRIFEPLKNCWWLMVKFQVGNCLRLSVINPPTPEPPKAHLTGANRSATNPGAFWSITNGATVVTVTDTIAAFTKHLKEKKRWTRWTIQKHRKHLGFNGNLNLKLDGGSWCVSESYPQFTKQPQQSLFYHILDSPPVICASSKISISGIGRFFCPETVRSWLPPPQVTEQGFQSEISKE